MSGRHAAPLAWRGEPTLDRRDGVLDPDRPDPVGPGAGASEQDLLRRLLGTRTLTLGATSTARLWGWLGPLLVTALAAVLRLVDLGRPRALVFDETYYVKQAYTLLAVGYEARWPEDADESFESGDLDVYLDEADYAVHPQVGKWLIATGMRLLGPDDPAGWRLASAVVGTLSVLMVARIARRLFGSTLLGTTAGLLLAVDGHHLVHSRTALLDVFLMFFTLAAFGAVVLDREDGRRRLARCVAAHGSLTGWGPRLGVRWWRLVAGVLLGLAVGTKWSGVFFVAVLGLLTVAWDVTARRAVGVRRWLSAGVLRDGVPAFLFLVPVALVTYLASWWSWFATPGSYRRGWAATHPGEGVTWLPDPLRSLWKYHQDMYGFHSTLTAEHTYAAHPLGWLVQWRPTSFYYESPDPGPLACGAEKCSAAITSLGNPVIWWLGTAALVVTLVMLVVRRDWRAGAVLSGVVAGWVPWLLLAHRTIFTFYAIAFAPFMVLALTYGLGLLLGPEDAGPGQRRRGLAALVAMVALCVLVSAFFLPLWTAETITYDQWRLRMWFPSWV